MKKIKLFTQNLYCFGFNKKQRINEVKEYIYFKKFDIIFVQEAIFYSDVKKLTKNNFAYYATGKFGPRGGLAIISKKKFDKIEFYKFGEQGVFFSRQIFDRLIEKGFLAAYSQKTIYIDTHLIATYESENGRKVEILNKQFRQLLKFIIKKKKEGFKIILGGDFNFNPPSRNYKELTKTLKDNTFHPNPVKYKYGFGQKDFILSSYKKSSNYSEPLYPIHVSDHPGIGVQILV